MIRTKATMYQRLGTQSRQKHALFKEACYEAYFQWHSRRGRVRFFHKICMGPVWHRSAECTTAVKVSPLRQHFFTHTASNQMVSADSVSGNVVGCDLYLRPWSCDVTREMLNTSRESTEAPTATEEERTCRVKSSGIINT